MRRVRERPIGERTTAIHETRMRHREPGVAIPVRRDRLMTRLPEMPGQAQNRVSATLRALRPRPRTRPRCIQKRADEAGIVRLVGALLPEQNDQGRLKYRYVDSDRLHSLPRNSPEGKSACAQWAGRTLRGRVSRGLPVDAMGRQRARDSGQPVENATRPRHGLHYGGHG